MTKDEARYHQVVRMGVAMMGIVRGVARPDVLIRVAPATLPVLSMDAVERCLREGWRESA